MLPHVHVQVFVTVITSHVMAVMSMLPVVMVSSTTTEPALVPLCGTTQSNVANGPTQLAQTPQVRI